MNLSAQEDGASFKKYWLISGSVAVNEVQMFPSTTFLVDTGTNVALLVPKSEYHVLLDKLFPKAQYDQHCAYFDTGITCFCSTLALASLPSVSLSLGGQSFALSMAVLFRRLHNENCQLQIQPQMANDPYWVLGAAFLETCALAFDFEHSRMGFARCVR
jgi:hypothetical protein